MSIINPILTGFNPDPSIIRVGEDYYIATSTFEWFPGVQIHHSKDLANWELVHRPLNRVEQLDLLGVPDSGGVWAPCLSYDKGTFYLVFSNVHSFDGVWKDTPNYLVTTKDILGEWSHPVFLNASGFDGSLFHDDDGRKYYLSMIVDHRKGLFFGGIILQEFDPAKNKLVGPVYPIFEGTALGKTEGPHIYKKDGYYYLLTAEGGTEYEHAVTMARSKQITGPYEVHPNNPILSAKDHPDAPLQKTGHADLVETENGDWYIVFLTGRPLSKRGRCILGRETGIAQIVWKEDGWPYLKEGGQLARVEIPSKSTTQIRNFEEVFTFDTEQMPLSFQSLRIAITPQWCDLTTRADALRLYGQQSLSSLHRQSLVARRVQHFAFEAVTSIDFDPQNFQQMAGLVCYYNSYHWYYLFISRDEQQQKHLQVIGCDKYQMTEYMDETIPVASEQILHLKVVWEFANIQFYFSLDKHQWVPIGPTLDGSILSDDYVQDKENRYRPAFTGAFVGLCCQDLTGNHKHADFLDWTYRA